MRLAAVAAVEPAWRNWSGNHECEPAVVHRPESVAELEHTLHAHHLVRAPVSCVGAGLSPNGLAFSGAALLSLERLNRVVHINPESETAVFEAGITVRDAMEAEDALCGAYDHEPRPSRHP